VFDVQGTSFAVALRGLRPPTAHGGVRKAITKFSDKSRHNCLRRLHRIAWGRVPCMLDICLTFPEWADEARTVRLVHDSAACKLALKNFLRRLERSGAVMFTFWKFEFGKTTRREHFHLLAGARHPLDQAWLSRLWRSCLEHACGLKDGLAIPVWIAAVRSGEAAVKYVAKYVAKSDFPASVEPSASPARGSGGSPGSGYLVSVPKTTGDAWTGRFWGISSRKSVPWADGSVLETPFNVREIWSKFRRVMRGYVKSVTRRELHGEKFTSERRSRLVRRIKKWGRGSFTDGRQVFLQCPGGILGLLRALESIMEDLPPGALGMTWDDHFTPASVTPDDLENFGELYTGRSASEVEAIRQEAELMAYQGRLADFRYGNLVRSRSSGLRCLPRHVPPAMFEKWISES